MGLTPFGNLLVLRNTGGDVGHPRFEVILRGERDHRCQLIGCLLVMFLYVTDMRLMNKVTETGMSHLIFCMKQKLAAVLRSAIRGEEVNLQTARS